MHAWCFRLSPARLLAACAGPTDAVQLELDCLRRTQQLLAAPGAPPATADEIRADQRAAFVIHQAYLADPTADATRLARLETALFLSRTASLEPPALFALFGKTCVPMQHALQRAGAWDAQREQPDAETTEAMARLAPAKDYWRHCFATRFENAAPLLAARKVLLRAGVAYFHARDVRPLLQHLCAASLRRFTAQLQHLLVDAGDEQLAHVARVSAQILARLRGPGAGSGLLSSGSDTADLRLDALPDTLLLHAPLCIRALLLKLKTAAGLKNDERCVLLAFLQTCSVERHVALGLFMQCSGLDERAFLGKYGRSIDFTYSKQSKCYGCAKIQDKGLCPFQDKQRVAQVLKVRSTGDTHPVDIEECFRTTPATPSAACAAVAERHGHRKRAFNPRAYFLEARAKRACVEKAPPAASSFPSTAARRARIQRVAQGLLPGR